ncbi:hypothetical protein UY3_17700 [Chelonia mydas]|uniref:Uncharacterized protein n=1 Tax=Chelonia mydas TaxID=8469 RepID=M7AL86_CHEMY|nr:hypothetical protein UY3_17700 [Chelonia mydas]
MEETLPSTYLTLLIGVEYRGRLESDLLSIWPKVEVPSQYKITKTEAVLAFQEVSDSKEDTQEVALFVVEMILALKNILEHENWQQW